MLAAKMADFYKIQHEKPIFYSTYVHQHVTVNNKMELPLNSEEKKKKTSKQITNTREME